MKRTNFITTSSTIMGQRAKASDITFALSTGNPLLRACRNWIRTAV